MFVDYGTSNVSGDACCQETTQTLPRPEGVEQSVVISNRLLVAPLLRGSASKSVFSPCYRTGLSIFNPYGQKYYHKYFTALSPKSQSVIPVSGFAIFWF
jgi:hypothetical protein